MGCDIHPFAEKRVDGRWQGIEDVFPFMRRDYLMFGFLADVRNEHALPTIAQPRGLPQDLSAHVEEQYGLSDDGAHSFSWLSVSELVGFNYDCPVADPRESVPALSKSGRCEYVSNPNQGEVTTLRVLLGQHFFDELRELQEAGVERIVFWFDN
jgi:hypothetical protein